MPPESSRPGPHPEPPDDLLERELPITTQRGPWYRIHRCQREPLHFGASGLNRFDAPGGEYEVCYLGSDAFCAFVETFGWATGIRAVTTSALAQRSLAVVQATRALRLIDLTGQGLARLGADERLCAGEHEIARRWALALWRHAAEPDGLIYRARHDPSRHAVAVFDRARATLRVASVAALDHPRNAKLLVDVLDSYGIGLIDDTAR